MRLLYAATFLTCATILTVLSLVTTSASAAEFVDINDACPVETPYLPEGAGTGVVVNGSMDTGWYAGVPDGWQSWKDETYISNVFFEENYQRVDGCCGQRLVLR